MLLLMVSSAVWKASRPDTPVDNISPITASLQSYGFPTSSYRHSRLKLERLARHRDAQRLDARGHGGELLYIIRIGRIAPTLQRTGKRADVIASAEHGLIARTAL